MAPPLPWLLPLVCTAASAALWTCYWYLIAGTNVFHGLFLEFYVAERSAEMRAALVPILVISLAGIVALRTLGPSVGPGYTRRRLSVKLIADLGLAVALVWLLWFTVGTVLVAPEWRDSKSKLEVRLPWTPAGVGRPPDDGRPDIVVAIVAGVDRRARVLVAGRPVEPTRAAIRDAIVAEAGRIGVAPRATRVRFDVAPGVRLQDVIIGIDATHFAGVHGRWFSGVP